MGAKDIHARKGLKKSQKILDHMGSTELAANLFRATQAEEKLKRENVSGKQRANQAHFEVGQKVRQTIKELVDHSSKTITNKPFGLSLSKASIDGQLAVRQAHRER